MFIHNVHFQFIKGQSITIINNFSCTSFYFLAYIFLKFQLSKHHMIIVKSAVASDPRPLYYWLLVIFDTMELRAAENHFH